MTAELATAFPENAGQAVYVREAFGETLSKISLQTHTHTHTHTFVIANVRITGKKNFKNKKSMFCTSNTSNTHKCTLTCFAKR